MVLRLDALLYAKDLNLVSRFYQQVFGIQAAVMTDTHHVLEMEASQLTIHAIPPHIAETFSITTPPERREDNAVKLIFTVDDWSACVDSAGRLGGEIFDGGWTSEKYTVRNGMDPEGNIFQIQAPCQK